MGDGRVTDEEVLLMAGKLLQNAAVCEQFMYMTLAILSETTPRVASAIFFNLEAFSSKKTLLTRLLDTREDEEDREVVEHIIRAAEKANNQRRELAHTLLLFDADGEGSAFRLYRPKHNKTLMVTRAWLDTLRRHSWDACVQGSEAFQKLSEKYGKPLTLDLK